MIQIGTDLYSERSITVLKEVVHVSYTPCALNYRGVKNGMENILDNC